MEFLKILGGVVGLVSYAILIVALFKTKTEQSFAAFLLWAMLDLIATITMIIQGGNFWLALSNVIGSTTIFIILIFKKQVSWSWVETMTAVLVAVCLVVWATAGERAGIIASSLAVVMASIPQMVDTYKKPESTPTLAYFIFTIGNVISLIGGKGWTIEERFYPACSIFLCVVIVVLSLRKKADLTKVLQ